jgi:hypothetical protein
MMGVQNRVHRAMEMDAIIGIRRDERWIGA